MKLPMSRLEFDLNTTIPGETTEAIIMCIPPTIFICLVLDFSTLKVLVVSLISMSIGLVIQSCLKFMEKKIWMNFSLVSSELLDIVNGEHNHSLSG